MMEPKYIEVSAEVRYWEDATINGQEDVDGTLTPLKRGDLWCPIINLATGQVQNWPLGETADIHFKVCDAGEYWLLNETGKRIAKWGGFYVPDNFLCPGTNGYGDYIIMQIDAEGFVKKWKKPAVEFSSGCRDDEQKRWLKIGDPKGGEA